MNSKTKKLTKTALMLALLLTLQYVSASFGQLVTGSLVNMVLILSTLMIGYGYASILAIISPILAFLLGIGPAFLPVVPFISIANLVYILIFSLYEKSKNKKALLANVGVLLVASVLKFLVLYFGLVKLALPILGIPDKAKLSLSVMMGYPQLLTAAIGGILAIAVYVPISKAVEK